MPKTSIELQLTDFSAKTRAQNLQRLAAETFDVLVIGGGVTGAGIARLAAQRGYRVALIEKGDWASGTSSKSSKLVHGGLRYLATGSFDLVYQALRQRRKLRRRAPHLVCPLPFVLPIYRAESVSFFQMAVAMALYEGLAIFRDIHHPEMWNATRTLANEPLLNRDGLVGAAHYYDCATDDARLTLTVVMDAHRTGAIMANYAEAKGLLRTGGRVVGAQVCDQMSQREFEIRARAVINAVGPWTDAWLNRAGVQSDGARKMRPTKGVHIIVSRERAFSHAALTFLSPRDRRFLYLIPSGSHAIIGSTDTDYDGSPDELYAIADDVSYLLEAAGKAFPSAHLETSDVISTFAGLRPLIREEKRAIYQNTREHRVYHLEPGLLAIAGGKLTTYRAMAREVVKNIPRAIGVAPDLLADIRLDRRHLPGSETEDWDAFVERAREAIVWRNGLTEETAKHLVKTYGTEVYLVLRELDRQPALSAPIAPNLPYVQAEILHAIHNEMAMTLLDVLERRTHIFNFARDQGLGVIKSVADRMARELGWTDAERSRQIAEYAQQVELNRQWKETS